MPFKDPHYKEEVRERERDGSGFILDNSCQPMSHNRSCVSFRHNRLLKFFLLRPKKRQKIFDVAHIVKFKVTLSSTTLLFREISVVVLFQQFFPPCNKVQPNLESSNILLALDYVLHNQTHWPIEDRSNSNHPESPLNSDSSSNQILMTPF